GKSKRLPAKKGKKICCCEQVFYNAWGKKITLFAPGAHEERNPAQDNAACVWNTRITGAFYDSSRYVVDPCCRNAGSSAWSQVGT
ncbi:MAG: hypothetical protein E7I10_25550, partial [Enterobacter asburiae]|nr:hypothetical protein [Enterobacter asburiae]